MEQRWNGRIKQVRRQDKVSETLEVKNTQLKLYVLEKLSGVEPMYLKGFVVMGKQDSQMKFY